MSLLKQSLIVLAISLLPFIAVLTRSDLIHTHDGSVHLPRMAAYFKALADGQILPRWAGDLNFGYGLPLFNFIYHTPYLLGSFFIATGASLVLSFKLVIVTSYILAGIGMFLFAKEFFGDSKKALLVTIFYQFAPFRLVETHTRGSLGELYTYAFLPLLLYFLTKIMKKFSLLYLAFTAVTTALLIISHNSISLIFFGVALLYVLFFHISKRGLLLGLIGLILGLALSTFYWAPALLEHKYTYGNLLMKDLFRLHFAPIQNFFIPNFFNSSSLQTEGISVQIGFFHTIAFLLTLFLLLKNKVEHKYKKLLIFCLSGAVFSLFIMSKWSLPLWENISLLRQFQFPWRFLALINFVTALMTVVFLQFKLFQKNIYYIILIILVITTTLAYWKSPFGYDVIADENQYWNYSLNTTYFGETDLIWSAGPAKGYPKAQAEFIEGSGSVSNFYKKSNIHTYTLSAQTDSRLVDHTQYFPGWRVYVDDVKTPIEFQNPNWRGLITFAVPPGDHHIKVAFERSKVQLVSEIVSATTIIMLLVSLTFHVLKINPIRKYISSSKK